MADRVEVRWAVAVVGDRVLLRVEGSRLRLPTHHELVETLGEEVLANGRVPGELHAGDAFVAAIGLPESLEPPADFELSGLRAAYHALPEAHFRAAGTARQRVQWHRSHAFCSRCGTPTTLSERGDAMACPACGQHHFPRIAPAVIVLVQRGPETLLARSPHFTPGVYSTLAGFVEPGESLEECVHREIEEEVGVRVENLRYFGSQPHPFPHSLMIGFVADWRSGDIRIDADEIEDAKWFARDALPDLPHPMSIARALIEDFVERTRP